MDMCIMGSASASGYQWLEVRCPDDWYLRLKPAAQPPGGLASQAVQADFTCLTFGVHSKGPAKRAESAETRKVPIKWASDEDDGYGQ